MLRGTRRSTLFRDLLPNTLMGSCPVEVRHIRIEDALELLLVEDEQLIKAFLPHTPGEAFADRVGSGSMIWRFKNLNSTRCRHTSETGTKFAIVITHQIPRCLPIWGGFPEVLRYPGIGRRSCHAYVDYLP
jgi:hypothetical protein